MAVSSAMYQRYPEFSPHLVQGLLNDYGYDKKSEKSSKSSSLSTAGSLKTTSVSGLASEEREKQAILRKKTCLRLLVQLYLSGVAEDPQAILAIVTGLLDQASVSLSGKAPKTDQHPVHKCLAMLVHFARSLSLSLSLSCHIHTLTHTLTHTYIHTYTPLLVSVLSLIS